MSAVELRDPVIDQLEHVLDRGDLPPPYDRWGARLLAHLTKPVQVVITGLAGSGKSALLEMLTARSVLGRNISLPVVEMVYGPAERALIERADGSVSSIMGYLRDIECPADAVRARQELPDPAMMRQDFIEIGLHGSAEQKRATLQSAVTRADVMIWCSQTFDQEEQDLWDMVPDLLKDHSVLALTMADQQMMRGVLTDHIARLEPIVAEGFLGLFPVATLHGISARSNFDQINDALWASSGGQPLMELITRQVQQGRKADVDQARIFMERLATRAALRAQRAVPELQNHAAPDEQVPAAPSNTGDLTQGLPSEMDTAAADAFAQAAEVIQSHAQTMFDQIEAEGEIDPDQILAECTDAMTAITGLLDAANPGDVVVDAVRDDVQESEEMLMLFQLEQGEEAALDAVTLMLQIRKELIDKISA